MERTVAIKKLGNLLGKKLGYRVDPRAPKQEEREAARADLRAAREVQNKLREQRDARFAAILAADSEYQNLKAAFADAQKLTDRLISIMFSLRNRFRLAWMVFTGEADALRWPFQNPKAWGL